MKLALTLQYGSRTSEHQLELGFPQDGSKAGGKFAYTLDHCAGEADCVRIAPGVFSILLGGRSYEVRIAALTTGASANFARRIVTVGARHYTVDVHDPRRRRGAAPLASGGGPQEVVICFDVRQQTPRSNETRNFADNFLWGTPKQIRCA